MPIELYQKRKNGDQLIRAEGYKEWATKASNQPVLHYF